MQRQNRIFTAVQSRSGASLIFVLAIMLLLMAVGTSALVAASAAAGTGLSKQEGDRLDLYAESIHKSVMYSLQTATRDKDKYISGLPSALENPETLGGQILAVVYEEAKTASASNESDASVSSYEYAGEIDFALTPTLTGGAGALAGVTHDLKLFIEPYVRVVKEHEPEYFVADENGAISKTEPPVPREVSISAKITVMVSVAQQGKSLTSVATYLCTGGFLKGEGGTGQMKIEKAGDWELASYEKIDR